MPRVQDKRASRCSQHHWSLHQLRHWDADPLRQEAGALGEARGGLALSAGRLVLVLSLT